ncbi:MAG: hypothetical protein EAZ92_11125 [Candidatus Kapaibacterium sp.]|nr:MAG: hypothetical protein EAZ92_11125 [Candidatus Kapabacteria bacterium]
MTTIKQAHIYHKYLLSNDAKKILSALDEIDSLEEADYGLFAWLWVRWEWYYSITQRDYRRLMETEYFQCHTLGWRQMKYGYKAASGKQATMVYSAIERLLEAHCGKTETRKLIAAAMIFNDGYSEMVDHGNHASSGYDVNVERDWKDFLPYKHHFEALLGTSPLFDAEWITAAQVIWQHFRWFKNDYDRTFSADAAGYFLCHAVRLKPAFPIHYMVILSQRERYKRGDWNPFQEDQYATLQTPLGITFLYHAQYCNFHEARYDEALEYYQRFLDCEQGLLPDNIFEIRPEYAMYNMLQASSQQALAEMAVMMLKQGNMRQAEVFCEQAIAMRPNYFQAPYQVLARIRLEQGYTLDAARLLEKKAVIFRDSVTRTAWWGSHAPYFEITYNPECKQNSFVRGDSLTRIERYFIHQFAQQAAMLFLQAQNLCGVQRMLKFCKCMPQYFCFDYSETYTMQEKPTMFPELAMKQELAGILEWQAEIAFWTKDYWQARLLQMQWEEIEPENLRAVALKQEITRVLGY